jgi:beta-galactosidase GanA
MIWGFRGKTVLGKWENGRRYSGREIDIQRYNGRRKTGLGKWGDALQLFDIFSFLLRRLASLKCGKKLLDCSDSVRRILDQTQVPKIGNELKFPNKENKKKNYKIFTIT